MEVGWKDQDAGGRDRPSGEGTLIGLGAALVPRVVNVAFVCAFMGVPAAAGGGHFVTTRDGVKVYYDAVGSGVPIVMIAGGPGSSSARFRYTHSLLQPLGRLVYLDNRGRGRSEQARSREPAYSLDNDLLDVEAVRTHLGAERIIIYGHSYGSMVALAYASRFPTHTMALMTTAGIHGARVWQERNIDTVKRFIQYHMLERWRRIIELRSVGQLTGEGELAQLFDGMDELYTYNPESESRLHAQLADYNDPNAVVFNPDVYREMVGDDPEWKLGGTLKDVELLPGLAEYKGPALIMGGRYDRICPPINQFEIAEALHNAKLVIFEHSGHAPFTEEPLLFLQVVTEFLLKVVLSEDVPDVTLKGNHITR
ncbi:MAG: alpha/beta fold hydrolase [Phycisphaerae bacterium]